MKAAILGLMLMLAGGAMGQSAVHPIYAQDATLSPAKKIAVKFYCNCSDSTGEAFATAFRDLLATSPRYSETIDAYSKPPNAKETPNWQIKALSLDPSAGNTGQSTVLSIVFLLGDTYYFTQMVQTCERPTVNACASDVLASFDRYLHSSN